MYWSAVWKDYSATAQTSAPLMPSAALVGSFWIKCTKSHCLAVPRKWHLKVWSGESEWTRLSKRAHSSFTNEQVEKPGQTYKHRQRRNQPSKAGTYGPEMPLHHLPPFAMEMPEMGAAPSFEQWLESPSFHRECSSLKQDILGRIILVYLWKACVSTFGCSHLKPFYLASLQSAHLTKYNWQP